jgi:[NiFe] hydrogenase assembly HybE family chaperone
MAAAATAGTAAADRAAPPVLHECGVCWHPYDPAEGDPSRAIAPGTAFEALPDDWRCPQCDAMKVKFLRTTAPRRAVRERGPGNQVRARVWSDTPDGLARALEDEMRRKALDGMAALPISNPRLRVEAVGFLAWRGITLGVLVTPWSMLLVAVPPQVPEGGWPDGAVVELELPSGRYDLMPARFERTGAALLLSLFSPMDTFDSPESARAAAKGALLELMTPPPAQTLDRRAMLRGEAPAAQA